MLTLYCDHLLTALKKANICHNSLMSSLKYSVDLTTGNTGSSVVSDRNHSAHTLLSARRNSHKYSVNDAVKFVSSYPSS